jgi:hypothetical protein
MYYKRNQTHMDDGDSTKNNKQTKRQANKNKSVQRYSLDVGSVLQSFWIRCRSIFPNTTDRQFMESELRFVLYCGFIFWTIYLLYEIFK